MAWLIAKKWLVAVFLILILSGCAQGSGETPAAPALPTLTQVVVRATETSLAKEVEATPKTSAPTDALASTPQPVEGNPPVDKDQPARPPADASFQGPLSVIITSPLDEAVVTTAQLVINGEADPETVITINDQIVLVGKDRKFSAPLVLEEGPNIIEITASDLDGNQDSAYLTVTYDPQP